MKARLPAASLHTVTAVARLAHFFVRTMGMTHYGAVDNALHILVGTAALDVDSVVSNRLADEAFQALNRLIRKA